MIRAFTLGGWRYAPAELLVVPNYRRDVLGAEHRTSPEGACTCAVERVALAEIPWDRGVPGVLWARRNIDAPQGGPWQACWVSNKRPTRREVAGSFWY